MPLQKGTFYSLRGNLAAATGFVSGEDGYVQHFTVLKGATGPVECVQSFVELNYYVQYRNDLLDQRILINEGDYLKLTRDHEFIGGPSLAATILLGRKESARNAWKEDTETRPKNNSIKQPAQQVADGYDAPLQRFAAQVRGLPRKTEAERLVVQRIGQDVFRDCLMEYWQGQCPITGIRDRGLLVASHIKPWADCQSDEERLYVYNGLLLSPFWNHVFDRGQVTFNDGGYPQFSPHLSQAAWAELGCGKRISLTSEHQNYLAYHRQEVFQR